MADSPPPPQRSGRRRSTCCGQRGGGYSGGRCRWSQQLRRPCLEYGGIGRTYSDISFSFPVAEISRRPSVVPARPLSPGTGASDWGDAEASVHLEPQAEPTNSRCAECRRGSPPSPAVRNQMSPRKPQYAPRLSCFAARSPTTVPDDVVPTTGAPTTTMTVPSPSGDRRRPVRWGRGSAAPGSPNLSPRPPGLP